MSYKTLAVELDHGRVVPQGGEPLPPKARGLLTILEASPVAALPGAAANPAGLKRLLATTDFPLSPEQFRASMEADFWEQ